VRQPLLIVGLEEGTGLHRKPQRQALGRPAVLADEVRQAVRQRRGLDRPVERNRLLQVDGLRDEAGAGEQRRRRDRKEMFLH